MRTGLGNEAGKAVFEYRHLIIAGGQFGRVCRIGGRRQRVAVGRRQEGPVLAVRGIDDPFLQNGVAAKMSIDCHGFVGRARYRSDRDRSCAAIEPQPSPVALDVFGAMHHLEWKPGFAPMSGLPTSITLSVNLGTEALGRGSD